MKKLLVLCAALLPAFASLAQTEKGHILLSGGSDLGFTTARPIGTRKTTRPTSPQLQGRLFVIDA
jgi:hypothetical protein